MIILLKLLRPKSQTVNYTIFDVELVLFYVLVFYESIKTYFKLECGPMPNLMVALPNTGGALCSTPQSLADAHY